MEGKVAQSVAGRQAASLRLDLATLTIVSGLLFLPDLVYGAPFRDSYLLNVSWADAFIEEIRAGTLYPRWLPSLWDGTGAADFYFYAPLPFHLTALIKLICGKCDVSQSLSISAFLLRIVSGIGMLGLLRSMRVPGPPLLGAVVFLIMPHHFGNWTERQAFGELAGTAFAPYLLWGLVQAYREEGTLRVTLATALIALSHLPTLLIMALVSCVLSLTVLRPPSARQFMRWLLAGALGLGLAAVYWLPAVSLLDTVNSGALHVFSWRQSMLSLHSLDIERWQLFLGFNVVTAIAIAVGGRPLALHSRVQIAILLTCWFFITPLATPLWTHTPVEYIQFPWRFQLVAEVAFAITAPVLWARAAGDVGGRAVSIAKGAGLTAATALALSLMLWWKPADMPPVLGRLLDLKPGALEWLGRSEAATEMSWKRLFKSRPPILGDLRQVRIKEGSKGQIKILAPESAALRFRADCPEDCTLVVRRSYWQYWELVHEEPPRRIALRPTTEFPLIEATLPPGSGTYRLRLNQPPVVMFGAVLSLVALLVILAVHLRLYVQPRSRSSPEA